MVGKNQEEVCFGFDDPTDTGSTTTSSGSFGN